MSILEDTIEPISAAAIDMSSVQSGNLNGSSD